jgi:hypothetical protein
MLASENIVKLSERLYSAVKNGNRGRGEHACRSAGRVVPVPSDYFQSL